MTSLLSDIRNDSQGFCVHPVAKDTTAIMSSTSLSVASPTHVQNCVGCGETCTYYYNFGTAMGNNANRLLRIVDVPIAGACLSAISDLGGLIQPQTLVPKV